MDEQTAQEIVALGERLGYRGQVIWMDDHWIARLHTTTVTGWYAEITDWDDMRSWIAEGCPLKPALSLPGRQRAHWTSQGK